MTQETLLLALNTLSKNGWGCIIPCPQENPELLKQTHEALPGLPWDCLLP